MNNNNNQIFKKESYTIMIVFNLISLVFIIFRSFTFLIDIYLISRSEHQTPIITSINDTIIITFVILFIGILTIRYPLTIYRNRIYLPLYIVKVWQKRLIFFDQIKKISLNKFIPPYIKWYTPRGILAMTRNMISSQEYEKIHEKEGVWLETKDGKYYFLTDAYDLYTIYPIIKKECELESKNIEIDKEIIKRYDK